VESIDDLRYVLHQHRFRPEMLDKFQERSYEEVLVVLEKPPARRNILGKALTWRTAHEQIQLAPFDPELSSKLLRAQGRQVRLDCPRPRMITLECGKGDFPRVDASDDPEVLPL